MITINIYLILNYLKNNPIELPNLISKSHHLSLTMQIATQKVFIFYFIKNYLQCIQ